MNIRFEGDTIFWTIPSIFVHDFQDQSLQVFVGGVISVEKQEHDGKVNFLIKGNERNAILGNAYKMVHATCVHFNFEEEHKPNSNMITLSLWGKEGGKVNIMKETYFLHYVNAQIIGEESCATTIELVSQGVSRAIHVKESFDEVNQLLKGVKL